MCVCVLLGTRVLTAVHSYIYIFRLLYIFHQVSWIRKRDLHILTFGQVTYTNDARFSVIKSATGDLWTLRIRSVQLRDAGLYECQVSSEPKISKAVRLKVVGEYTPLADVCCPSTFLKDACRLLDTFFLK